MTVDIAAELAREEHAQGMPVTDNRGHCPDCTAAADEARRARCTHEERIDIASMCGTYRKTVCSRCGHIEEGDA